MLKLEIGRYKNLVFGKVLEMDEDMRNIEMIWEDDGLSISAGGMPELYCDELYLRGAFSEHDDDVFDYKFDSEEEAINMVDKIKIGVKEINSRNTKGSVKKNSIKLEIVE